MSYRIFSTVAIDCDSCDGTFADVVSVSQENSEKAAIREGWRKTATGHQCPNCQKEGENRLKLQEEKCQKK